MQTGHLIEFKYGEGQGGGGGKGGEVVHRKSMKRNVLRALIVE